MPKGPQGRTSHYMVDCFYPEKGQFDGNSLARALRYAVTRSKKSGHNEDEATTPRATVVGVDRYLPHVMPVIVAL